MIELRNVSKTVTSGTEPLTILHPLTATIPRGQFVAIVGPSGSGKSTLLGLIAGLDSPSSGSVVIDGVDITQLGEDELAKLRGEKIGFVFQFFHLIPSLTAYENVAVPMEIARVSDTTARARALLEEVGLTGRAHHYPSQLSGGEQQRVALARALANNPSIVLADEPTGNLDSTTGRHIMDLLRDVHRFAANDAGAGYPRCRARGSRGREDCDAGRACGADAMTFVLRMAVRETRSSWKRLLFFFICIAVGVAAIVALRSVIQNVRGVFGSEARSLIAADVLIATNREWTPAAREVIDRRLREAGAIERTETVETPTMARPADQSRATTRMVELRAVQPAFPLYGTMELDRGITYSHELLRDHGALVRPELLTALGLQVGDRVAIGQSTFAIRGVIKTEPGRRVGNFSLGPRVIIDLRRSPLHGASGLR